MDALHVGRREDRARGVAQRPEIQRHAPRDIPAASGAGGGGGENLGLLPVDLGGEQEGGAAFPVECEDALRKNIYGLSARQKARCQARVGADLQARRGGCLAGGSGEPRGLQRLAVFFPEVRFGSGDGGQEEAPRLFRLLPGCLGEGCVWQYQGEERMAPYDQLGSGGVR